MNDIRRSIVVNGKVFRNAPPEATFHVIFFYRTSHITLYSRFTHYAKRRP